MKPIKPVAAQFFVPIKALLESEICDSLLPSLLLLLRVIPLLLSGRELVLEFDDGSLHSIGVPVSLVVPLTASIQLLDHVIPLHAVVGLRHAADDAVVRSVVTNLLSRERLLPIEVAVELAARPLLPCFLLQHRRVGARRGHVVEEALRNGYAALAGIHEEDLLVRCRQVSHAFRPAVLAP